MAYRSRIIETVRYGKLPEYLGAIKELNEMAEKKGRMPARVLTPVAGLSNQVILEVEFPDLTSYQQQVDSFWADDEALRVWRGKAAVTVEGSGYTELLSDEDI